MKNSIEKAKDIYFQNFGSTYFMKRNGEFKTYANSKVPLEIESEWLQDVLKRIKTDLKHFDNRNSISSSLFHLCYLDISIIEKEDIILETLKNKNFEDIKVFEEIVKFQESLYSNEFLNILMKNRNT